MARDSLESKLILRGGGGGGWIGLLVDPLLGGVFCGCCCGCCCCWGGGTGTAIAGAGLEVAVAFLSLFCCGDRSFFRRGASPSLFRRKRAS